MYNKLWKRAAVAGLMVMALAGCSSKKPEGPVFATAEPLAAAKPNEFGFKHALRVKNLEGLNETVRRNLTVVLTPDDFVGSLRQSLANDQMLAPEGTQAAYELTPYFVDLRTAAVSERVTAAQAIFHYRVTRIDDGKVIFDKRIKANFSSVADPDFGDGGMFNRTLEVMGFVKPKPQPVVAKGPRSDETKGPGPEGDTAREVHASRNAIALNIRNAMRHLIVSSPERVVAPRSGTMPAAAPPAPPTPEDEPGTQPTEQISGAQEEEAADQPVIGPDGKPLPPMAPVPNGAADDEESDG